MRTALTRFTLVALLSFAPAAGAQPRVDDHLLGETAERFFSEAHEGAMLSACARGDFAKVDRSIKKAARESCAWLSSVRQRMIGDETGKYAGQANAGNTKTTTYVFVAGKFVAAEVLFMAPDLSNNYHGKSLAEISNGLKESYGPPTSETVVPYQNAYGVPYERHQILWLAESYAIQLDEQPGSHGWTSVNLSTREWYDKQKAAAAKPPPNPLN